MDRVDAHRVDELFPRATMLIWAAPHWHVADAEESCSPEVTEWATNDDYNVVAFEMLQRKLPGAEVLVPFPAHYSKAAASPACRPLTVPEVEGVAYRPLCSDPRWYQTLASEVVCLTTAQFLEEIHIADRVKQHLKAGEERRERTQERESI